MGKDNEKKINTPIPIRALSVAPILRNSVRNTAAHFVPASPVATEYKPSAPPLSPVLEPSAPPLTPPINDLDRSSTHIKPAFKNKITFPSNSPPPVPRGGEKTMPIQSDDLEWQLGIAIKTLEKMDKESLVDKSFSDDLTRSAKSWTIKEAREKNDLLKKIYELLHGNHSNITKYQSFLKCFENEATLPFPKIQLLASNFNSDGVKQIENKVKENEKQCMIFMKSQIDSLRQTISAMQKNRIIGGNAPNMWINYLSSISMLPSDNDIKQIIENISKIRSVCKDNLHRRIDDTLKKYEEFGLTDKGSGSKLREHLKKLKLEEIIPKLDEVESAKKSLADSKGVVKEAKRLVSLAKEINFDITIDGPVKKLSERKIDENYKSIQAEVDNLRGQCKSVENQLRIQLNRIINKYLEIMPNIHMDIATSGLEISELASRVQLLQKALEKNINDLVDSDNYSGLFNVISKMDSDFIKIPGNENILNNALIKTLKENKLLCFERLNDRLDKSSTLKVIQAEIKFYENAAKERAKGIKIDSFLDARLKELNNSFVLLTTKTKIKVYGSVLQEAIAIYNEINNKAGIKPAKSVHIGGEAPVPPIKKDHENISFAINNIDGVGFVITKPANIVVPKEEKESDKKIERAVGSIIMILGNMDRESLIDKKFSDNLAIEAKILNIGECDKKKHWLEQAQDNLRKNNKTVEAYNKFLNEFGYDGKKLEKSLLTKDNQNKDFGREARDNNNEYKKLIASQIDLLLKIIEKMPKDKIGSFKGVLSQISLPVSDENEESVISTLRETRSFCDKVLREKINETIDSCKRLKLIGAVNADALKADINKQPLASLVSTLSELEKAKDLLQNKGYLMQRANGLNALVEDMNFKDAIALSDIEKLSRREIDKNYGGISHDITSFKDKCDRLEEKLKDKLKGLIKEYYYIIPDGRLSGDMRAAKNRENEESLDQLRVHYMELQKNMRSMFIDLVDKDDYSSINAAMKKMSSSFIKIVSNKEILDEAVISAIIKNKNLSFDALILKIDSIDAIKKAIKDLKIKAKNDINVVDKKNHSIELLEQCLHKLQSNPLVSLQLKLMPKQFGMHYYKAILQNTNSVCEHAEAEKIKSLISALVKEIESAIVELEKHYDERKIFDRKEVGSLKDLLAKIKIAENVGDVEKIGLEFVGKMAANNAPGWVAGAERHTKEANNIIGKLKV